MERRNGLGVVIIGVIVAVALFVWAGGAWLPRAKYEEARAQHEAALAVRLNAESLNILSRAGAGAIWADTAQSWLLPLALVVLAVLLVVVVVINMRRRVEFNRVIAALIATQRAQLPAPALTIEEVRGKLKHYEEVLR